MAKSKRSKHMRAMRRLLREKLSKKDEAKRLAAMKNDNLIPATAKTTVKDSSTLEGKFTILNTIEIYLSCSLSLSIIKICKRVVIQQLNTILVH